MWGLEPNDYGVWHDWENSEVPPTYDGMTKVSEGFSVSDLALAYRDAVWSILMREQQPVH